MSTAERLAERIDAIMKLVDEFGSARLHAEKYPAGKGAQSYVKTVRAEIQRSLGLLAAPADGGGQGVTPPERCQCGYPMPCSTTVPIGFCKAGTPAGTGGEGRG